MSKRQKTIHNEQYQYLLGQLSLERRRLGLSQAEVAESLGMTQSEISKIETGERRVDILEFKNIINVYRVNKNEKLNGLVVDFLSLGNTR